MLIAELVRNAPLPLGMTPYMPFAWTCKVRRYAYALFWTDTFGAPDDSQNERVNIRQITRDYLNKYTSAPSLATCLSQSGSFFFDHGPQELYIHMEHAFAPYTCMLEHGFAFGMSDQEVVYINDYEYLPLIESIPSIERQADAVNATEATGVSGSAVLKNRVAGLEGPLDFLIDENVYGSDFLVYSYDPETGGMTPLACFFVEDYSYSLASVSVNLQDKRKAQDIKIPTALFSKSAYPNLSSSYEGKAIPLVYGQITEIEAFPVNTEEAPTSGSVQAVYRIPDGISSGGLGVAFVEVEKVWTAAAIVSADYASMLLTVSNGRDSGGSTRRLKLVGCTGLTFGGNAYPADIIADLNERFLGIRYNDANYDTAEWAAEAASPLIAADIGFALVERKALNEVIFDICSRSKGIFRYEFTPDNRITIRVRDWERPAGGYIASCDIKDRDLLTVETDSANVFSSVSLKYAHNYLEDTDLVIENSDQRLAMISRYRTVAVLEEESFLQGQAAAAARAAADALAYSEIPHIASMELFGFFDLKIFDVLYIALSADDTDPAARGYFGVRRCMILSVNPDEATGINKVTAQVRKTHNIGSEDGALLMFEDYAYWLEA